jgi:flavin reductase (DIM6/NTAB) family NADH-FMN oxidoreductase RutF
VDLAAFRTTMSLLASGVAVISAQDPESGKPRGMTANALMSVSLEPPLIVVSVRRRARLHAALQAAGGYGVTVLGEGQEVQARRFAGMVVAGHEKPPAFTERCGIPVLDGGLAWIVTRVSAAHPAGDHTLFVGEIVDLGSDRPGDPPLAFHRSAFARLIPATPRSAVPLQAWDTGLDAWG